LGYFCTMGEKKIDKTSISAVLYTEKGWNRLDETIGLNQYTSIFVLTDTNTNNDCLPLFDNHFQHAYTLLTMEAGETNKHLATCEDLWASLSEQGADRNSLLINLGGGVVTDLGGFVACTYKRGIDFINIPTSLLAMVDASVGGKTGVDFQGLKNQIGIIKEPEFVVIDEVFLQTLPLDERRSGYAEMLKHGLIADAEYFSLLSSKPIDINAQMTDLIHQSVSIKSQVVTEDPFEQGMRKILNYGHTLGHAIETHFLEHPTKKRLLHGEAIAIGMIMEAELSCRTTDLTVEERDRIKTVFSLIYDPVLFTESDVIAIKGLLKHDKKNQSDQVRFVLLQTIGKPIIDCLVSEEDINAAFQFYAD
jgi:3-dehydroquinate synthase